MKFPFEYSEKRIIEKHRFWNERYLLHAFMLFNNKFDVVWGSNYMFKNHKDGLVKLLPCYTSTDGGGGSFWIRKRPDK